MSGDRPAGLLAPEVRDGIPALGNALKAAVVLLKVVENEMI